MGHQRFLRKHKIYSLRLDAIKLVVTKRAKSAKTLYGPVVQLVRTLACHARGQGFEPPSGRHTVKKQTVISAF